MTIGEQMLAVYRKRNEGKIPLAAYGGFLLPSGSVERELRNKGCGWIHWSPVCTWQPPGMSHMSGWIYESEIKNVEMSVKTVWRENKRVLFRIYDTPLGSVYEELREESGYHSLWIRKFLIEDLHDYEIVKFMIENTVFRETYDTFTEARDNLGDDGVELAVIDRSPFQKLLIEICGTERLTFDLNDHQNLVEDLLFTMEKKQEEAFKIIIDSSAEIIWMVDNTTGDITKPKWFEKYCVPFYNKLAKLLHEKNKILAVHFDGKLNCIKELIKNTGIDVIESFSLPEMGGNLSIEEASRVWEDKAIIANLPAFLCLKEEKEVRKYMQNLLKKVYPRKNFMLELSENFPQKFLKTTLPIIANVLENQ